MNWQPKYSKWRHGGWYVSNVRYPSGACGCVSRNYDDHKWRIVCDPRGFEAGPTFRTRYDAAWAELQLATAEVPRPQYYECGICGHCHPLQWNGDCREDAARFTNQQLDEKHGIGGWDEVEMSI